MLEVILGVCLILSLVILGWLNSKLSALKNIQYRESLERVESQEAYENLLFSIEREKEGVASTIENLQNHVGKDGIEGLTGQTKTLLEQQKNLMDNIKGMEPFIKTAESFMDKMDLMWVPVHRSWRLNERHYGALQGLNKKETAAIHGADQVKLWRRSYDIPPPSLNEGDERLPDNDPRYALIPPIERPRAESLSNTVNRFLPYWEDSIVPSLKLKKNIIICAHGNSLRALIKYLDNMSEEAIVELNIPTGIPLIYELNDDLTIKTHYYLGDSEIVKKAAKTIEEQGK